MAERLRLKKENAERQRRLLEEAEDRAARAAQVVQERSEKLEQQIGEINEQEQQLRKMQQNADSRADKMDAIRHKIAAERKCALKDVKFMDIVARLYREESVRH